LNSDEKIKAKIKDKIVNKGIITKEELDKLEEETMKILVQSVVLDFKKFDYF